jgi:signal peptidase II
MARWRGGSPEGPLSPLGLGVVVAVVVLDQIAKFAAEAMLPLGEAIELLPILTLYRVANTGIAFSFFAGSGVALIILMLVVSAVVIGFWVRTHEGGRLAAIGFALILGGAIGNLIDRVRLGYVVDFLLLHLGDWTLFVFNLADAALTLGPALLILVYLFPGKDTAGA